MIARHATGIVCLFFLLIFCPEAFNQEKSYRISIDYPANTPNAGWIEKLDGSSFSDSLELVTALELLRGRFYKVGYLSAGFDFLYKVDSTYFTRFSAGHQYNWGHIMLPESHPPEISRIPKFIRAKTGQAVSISKSESIREALLGIYENNGYPFASVRYGSLSFSEGYLNANLLVESGPLVRIDSIINRSSIVVSNRVLEQIIGLKSGQLYSEKRLIAAGIQLDNSKIIQTLSPLEVGFNEGKAWVYLGAKKKVSNSFDGIVGISPGASNARGFALTGSLDLILSNLAKQAETLSILWKAPGNQNQRLQAGLNVPYFLGWPLGFSSSMEIFRKDSSYLNTNWSFGIHASLPNQNSLGFFYKEKTSNIILNRSISTLSDVKVKLYGLSWIMDRLKNPVNPTRGIFINAYLGVGNKSSQDIGDENTNVYMEGEGMSDLFIPITKTWVFHLGARGAYLNGGQVYENEKFKLGGLHSLRGFDEESILSDAYLIGTFELRYLFSKNSNVHLFLDAGSLWNTDSYTIDKPKGFGLGVSLETRAGILLLDYAFGVSEDVPLNIRLGKIHLGIKSLF